MMMRFGVAVGCLALLLSVGCGKSGQLKGLVPVSGTVKYNGTPIEGASVNFAPVGQTPGGKTESRAAAGITDKDGKYTLTTLNPGDGAFPGEYEVSISKVETKQLMKYEDFYNKAGSSKDFYKGGKMEKPKMSESKSLLPEKFADPKKSGLKRTVKAGEPIDFDLK